MHTYYALCFIMSTSEIITSFRLHLNLHTPRLGQEHQSTSVSVTGKISGTLHTKQKNGNEICLLCTKLPWFARFLQGRKARGITVRLLL